MLDGPNRGTKITESKKKTGTSGVFGRNRSIGRNSSEGNREILLYMKTRVSLYTRFFKIATIIVTLLRGVG